MTRRALVIAALAATLSMKTVAVAHVDVLPTRVAPEQPAEFTARVPNERNVPVVKVAITFPPQVTVFSIAPIPGWTHKRIVARDQTVTGVVYTGGRIGVGDYTDFTFLGTPFQRGVAVWKARQTYADGITKPWTGPPEKEGDVSVESGPGAPGPASATLISTAAPADAAPQDGGTSSSAGIWLGIIAILLAGGALLATGFLWSTRPATLPPDDPDETPPPSKRTTPTKRGTTRTRKGGRRA